jgi:hypothetical protein
MDFVLKIAGQEACRKLDQPLASPKTRALRWTRTLPDHVLKSDEIPRDPGKKNAALPLLPKRPQARQR